MNAPRIFVLCPDYDEPSGGVRRLYRHVDVLCRHGARAWVLHRRPGFRCTWFDNDTPVMAFDRAGLTAADFLVVPEVYGPDLGGMAPGVPKVVFNQNAYFTFRGFAPGRIVPPGPYLSREVVAVFAVSEDNAAYLRHAFPGLQVRRIHYGIDPLFAPRGPKRRAIAYMPRKNADDAVQVLNILSCRGALNGWELLPIDGLPEAEVARRLAECLIFLSFGMVEGCPLPPLEAMACGCFVVGYHGRGGREYFDPSFSRPVEAGDIIGFARAIEEALRMEAETTGFLAELGRRAEAFVRSKYSPERERDDILTAWDAIVARR
jgi:glycosyltransferase involved in cell wall biosynthesis